MAEYARIHWPYVATVVLMLVGLYGMAVKRNLVKKLIGLNVFQAAIILFFIVHAWVTDGSVPIWDDRLPDAAAYVNPIPHGLMLTAIVVSVATTGVALALLIRIHRNFGTLDEDALLDAMRRRRDS
jgi:multicomponent Na+:H+ antiporter subunit C